jgi:outer membrane protein assembly factor BamB
MRKKDIKLVAMLLFVIMAVLLPATCFASGTDWTQFQYDLYNNGVTLDPAPITSPSLGWKQQVGNATMSGIDSIPLVAGGNVFVLDATGMAWAFNATTGVKQWSTQLNGTGSQLATPVYNGGWLYMATNNGYVYQLNAATGAIAWTANLSYQSQAPPAGCIACNSQMNTTVKYNNGLVYVGAWNAGSSTNEYYYCLNANTGQPGIGAQYQMPNTASPGGYYWAGACFVGNYMIFGSDNVTLTCIDANTGAFYSQVAMSSAVPADTPANGCFIRSSVSYDPANDMLFFTDEGGYCWGFQLDTSTGGLTWKWDKMIGFSTSTPAICNGNLYVGYGNVYGSGGGVYCLNESTGSVNWQYIATGNGQPSSGGAVQASPAISVQSGAPDVYFTTNSANSQVYCLDQHGDQVWDYAEQEPSGPARYTLQGVAISNGWLYFGNDSGYLYALQTLVVPVTGSAALGSYSGDLTGQIQVYVDGTQQATTDASGSYTISGVSPGSHLFTIESPGYLKASGTIDVAGGITIPAVTLLAGDVNGDGVINIDDYTDLVQAYGAGSGSSNWNAAADFDRNGVINIDDYTDLVVNYSKSATQIP